MVYRCQKSKTGCFQVIQSLLFHRQCLGRAARAYRDMLVSEFSSQEECSKIREKAWFSSSLAIA